MLRNLLLPLLITCFFSACGPQPGERGKQLAIHYCGSCHLPVSPTLLDKATWTKHVLPAMAPKLGIGVWNEDQYYPAAKDSNAAISYTDWKEIVDFYRQTAPDSLLPAKATPPLQEDWSIFRLKAPVWKDTIVPATTTMVSINPHNGNLYASMGAGPALYRWNRQLQVSPVTSLQSPAVDMRWQPNGDTALLTCIGNLRAVDAPQGSVLQVMPEAPSDRQIKTIGLGLPRPVQTIGADFNRDGLQDYLVCGFGHDYGGLYILQQTADEDYKKLPVWEVPGAIHAVVDDFDKDGWPDIMALFAYADEGVWLFLNDHKGGFRSRNLLRFPPVYGSTGFQLADMNGDGLQDIIYTAGDNGDYSMIMKPYHGVYIFLNKGNFSFEQAFFYPVNGCTKAIVKDFDGDGDLDMATIAFFADLQHKPAEKFIYFERTGPLAFVPHAVPVYGQGRWICMDAGDTDGDGDPDIVLGSFSRGFIIQDHFTPDWNTRQPLILLENTIK